MSALTQYVKHFIVQKAHEKICTDLKKAAIRDLRKSAGGATVLGVDLAVVNKLKRTYARDIQACLDELNHKIDEQKKIATDADKVTVTVTGTTIKGTIPKSTTKKVLGSVPAYAKYFGLS
jgi:hypothetical protein